MVPYYGEALVLYSAFVLQLVAISSEGWICGRIYSNCFLNEPHPFTSITLALLVIATIFTLIAAILQTICIVKHTERYLLYSKISTFCAAIFGVAGIFYYFDLFFKQYWSQHIAGFVAGITTGLSAYQMTNVFQEVFENCRLRKG
ncbi:unnamed protein product [Rodentolepis nana]|uniref:MARVEL domain-containing protein n=1 Tax=Rodentolepis nana TaxID=102285 RepID=A0A0R3TF08_RODNA|nr:unnamed protein product [Rodentolepis nana]